MLPIIFVALCVVLNVVAGLLLRAYSATPCSNDVPPLHIIIICGAMLVQQLLLLMKTFTFFSEVSFVVVFSPLFVPIFMIIIYLYTVPMSPLTFILVIVFGLVSSTSIVLMMLKADDVFGIGTSLDFGSSFPKFSWAVIMLPIWLVTGLGIPCCSLCMRCC